MTKLRAKEKDAFEKNKQDLKGGIDGVRTALGVLRDCYGGGDKAHEAAGEESTGIIGLLEAEREGVALLLTKILQPMKILQPTIAGTGRKGAAPFLMKT